jgi:uncharacterized membrane protein YccC
VSAAGGRAAAAAAAEDENDRGRVNAAYGRVNVPPDNRSSYGFHNQSRRRRYSRLVEISRRMLRGRSARGIQLGLSRRLILGDRP